MKFMDKIRLTINVLITLEDFLYQTSELYLQHLQSEAEWRQLQLNAHYSLQTQERNWLLVIEHTYHYQFTLIKVIEKQVQYIVIRTSALILKSLQCFNNSWKVFEQFKQSLFYFDGFWSYLNIHLFPQLIGV